MNNKTKGRFYAGVRFGLQTPTVILVALHLEEIVIVHETYEMGMRIDQVIREATALRDKYGILKWFCGPGAPRMVRRLKRARMRAVEVEDDLVAGINLISERLRRLAAKEPGGIIIKPECKNIGIEFQRFATKPFDPQKPFKDVPEATFNFALDTLRFLILGLHHTPEPNVRWL